MHGTWNMEHGTWTWNTEHGHGTRNAEHGTRKTQHGTTRNMEHGTWSMEQGTRNMEHRTRNKEHGKWNMDMEHGTRIMEHGTRNMEHIELSSSILLLLLRVWLNFVFVMTSPTLSACILFRFALPVTTGTCLTDPESRTIPCFRNSPSFQNSLVGTETGSNFLSTFISSCHRLQNIPATVTFSC